MIQEEVITNTPTDEIAEILNKKTPETLKKHITELMTKSVACFAYGRPHALPCCYYDTSKEKNENGEYPLLREVNMISNTRLYAQHQHVYHCLEEALEYNFTMTYSYIRDSHPQIWKDENELEAVVNSCLDYLDRDREIIHIDDVEFPMLCGDVTVQKQDCSILDTEGKYMVYPLPNADEYNSDDFEFPDNLDCLLLVQSSSFLFLLKEIKFFEQCKKNGKPVCAISFANVLDENTQKYIRLISKACEKNGIPVKVLTDGTSIAIHQFVLPLKHGYATGEGKRTEPICPSVKWIGLTKEETTKKISFMYRIAIPEAMKKSYFDVVDECTSLGEEKIANELREMMASQYAMSLIQIVAMVPCDFYIQWEDIFSKREGY